MTIKTLMTTSALSLLLATAAVAQTADSTAPAPAPMAGDSAPMDSTAGIDPAAPQDLSEMTVGDLTGTDVIDANGDSIGTINDVVQGPAAGEAVVGIGGFLGIGRHDVALPLGDLSYDPETGAVLVDLTRETLEAMPEHDSAARESLPAETQLAMLLPDHAAPVTPAAPAPAPQAPAAVAPLDSDTDSGGETTID